MCSLFLDDYTMQNIILQYVVIFTLYGHSVYREDTGELELVHHWHEQVRRYGVGEAASDAVHPELSAVQVHLRRRPQHQNTRYD